jgi:serine phosphatase RsbU (regulator of sigma subunit)
VSKIFLCVHDAELRASLVQFLRLHFPQYELHESSDPTQVIAKLISCPEPEDIIVLIHSQVQLNADLHLSELGLFERLRLETEYPWSAVRVLFLSSEDERFFRESMSLSMPILGVDKYYQILPYQKFSREHLAKIISSSVMLSRKEVEQIQDWFRAKERAQERAQISSEYRHDYISPRNVAAARLLQGAFLSGDVEPDLAASILSEFASDEEGREKLREYVELMVNEGYVTRESRHLTNVVKRVLLIDDQYAKNGWGKVLAAIFSDDSEKGTKLHCEATISNALTYLEGLPGTMRKPFVLLDLLLKDEAELIDEDAINEAIREGIDNKRRLIEFDTLLPILVFTKHGSSPEVYRMLREQNLKFYLKEIDEDHDELNYYEKFCKYVRVVQDDADRAKDREEARVLHRRLSSCQVPSSIPGLDIAADTVPYRELGGDYYSIRGLADGRVLIVIADVSGKGNPAAILTAILHGTIRPLVFDNCEFTTLIERLNECIYKETESNQFITAFVGALDIDSGKMTYWNAGHNPPILIRLDQSTTYLEEGGPPLGMLEYPAIGTGTMLGHQTHLHQGDVLILYTDGISEAENNESNEFGVGRLLDQVRQGLNEPANNIVNSILQKVSDFAEDQADDRTIVILKML